MSDDNQQSRQPADRPEDVTHPVDAEDGSDPTPVAPQRSGATAAGLDLGPVLPADREPVAQPVVELPEDHSAWMRPAEQDRRRTSEVVGAVAPPAEPGSATEVHVPVAQDGTVLPTDTSTHDIPARGRATAASAALGARAAMNRERAGADLGPAADGPAWRRVLPIGLGVLAVALVAGGVVYANTKKSDVVVQSSAAPSVDTSFVGTNQLVTPADAAKVSAKAVWSVASTTDHVTDTSAAHVTCLASTTGQANPVITRQRGLSSKGSEGLALLQQVDGFASATDARKVFQMRATALAGCAERPVWIRQAATVTGLGDEAASITVAEQGATTLFHTIVLVRSGRAIHAFDVSRPGEAASAQSVVAMAESVISRQCGPAGGSCTKGAKAITSLPTVSGTPGWLVPNDLPRVTAGSGQWSSTDTAGVTTKGTGCEGVDLPTATGPVKSEQRTFLVNQDSAAPATYGIDEVVYTFADAKGATAFGTKVSTALNQCAARVKTAKTDQASSAREQVGATSVLSNTLRVQESMGNNQNVIFRTAVVIAGKKVVYLVNNPSASYDMGQPNFNQVALRAGERATQQ